MKIALIGYGKMGHAIEEAALSVGMRLFVASTKTIRKISIQFHSKAPMSLSSSQLRRSPSTIIGGLSRPAYP